MGKLLAFLAKLFGYLLNFIYVHVNNYGLAIILFTVAVQIILLPFFIKQQKTLIKNSRIQGKLAELREKYKNDQVRLGQETMDLYKREHMSPFSGCLGTILQFIIILAMFFLVSRPLTYMKHIDADTINNYTKQLVEQTNGQLRYTEIAIIKNMSEVDDRVKINMNFLGLDLSDVPSQNYKDLKVFIIPVLYVLTSIVSTKLTTNLNKSINNNNNNDENIVVEENNEDKELVVKKDKEEDAMAEMSKQMTLMMPIMSVSIALIAPLGLALYWLVSNLLMICERLIINKYFSEEEEKESGE